MGPSIVTLLFTDLVGSTDLYQRLGDEGAEQIRRRHFRLLRDAVTSRGGHEVKSLGDGLMVVFESAVEAVACAVTMQQAVHRANERDPSEAIGVRVGLHTGEPIKDEEDYFGTPVAVAKRLCDIASGGQIIASALVQGLVGSRGVAFTSLGSVTLKGIAVPMSAYEVAWEPAKTSRISLPAQFDSPDRLPLVGRSSEAEIMRTAYKEALSGRPQLILISGEPGIGKTRLATEFVRWAYDEGATVLLGRCDEDPLAAYQPIVEALGRYVKAASTDELRTNAGRHASTLQKLVPDMRDRLPGIADPMSGDAETERTRLFDAVTALLCAAAHDAPVVLVLDDVHWAQQPTLLLMRHIVREAEDANVVVIATYRETELARTHPLADLLAELRREESGCTRIALRGLDADGVIAFLEGAGGEALTQEGFELARSLHEITEGNPFFLREVLRHLSETGAILHDDGRWTGARPVAELGLPEGVKEVIGRRLSSLSEEANNVLRVAAVIGREFDLRVVTEATSSPEETVLSRIEEAVASRTVAEVPNVLDRYAFSHALIRETLLEELTTSRKVRLHRAVGEAIEQTHRDDIDEHLAQLAFHFGEAAEAGEAERAIAYARRAAERAMTQFAYEEAIGHYEKAIEWLESATTSRDRLACEVHIELAEAQYLALGTDVSRETVRRILGPVRDLGDADLIARAALSFSAQWGRPGNLNDEVVRQIDDALSRDVSPILRAELLQRLAAEYFIVDVARAKELSDEAIAIGREVGNQRVVGHALWTRQWVDVIDKPAVDELIAMSQELLDAGEAVRDGVLVQAGWWVRMRAALIANDPTGTRAAAEAARAAGEEFHVVDGPYFDLLRRAMFALYEGRLVEAEGLVHETLMDGQRIGSPLAINQYSAQLLVLRWMQGRLDELEPVMRAMREADPEIPWYAAHALVLVYLDRPDEAREIYEPYARARFTNIRRDANWLAAIGAFGMVCWYLQDAEHAPDLFELLRPWAGCNVAVGAPCFLSMNGSHHLAMLAATMERWDEAEELFARGLKEYEAMGIKTWPVAVRREFASALARRGRPGDADRARDAIERALADARALDMHGEAQKSQELLDALRG